MDLYNDFKQLYRVAQGVGNFLEDAENQDEFLNHLRNDNREKAAEAYGLDSYDELSQKMEEDFGEWREMSDENSIVQSYGKITRFLDGE